MPIEDSFSINDHSTVVTGRIETGVIRVGDEVQILGLGIDKYVDVADLEMFHKTIDHGEAGDNAGILLRGIKKSEIKRGMVICKPNSTKVYDNFKARIYVLKKEEGGRHTPFGNWYSPQFYLHTAVCTGEITLPEGVEMVIPDDDIEYYVESPLYHLRKEQIAAGDNVEIYVNLTHPVALNTGLKFAIREGGRTVGFGQITAVYD